MKIAMDPDWQEHVYAATDELFKDRLGPAIRDDAKRICPKRTGTLADSIEDHLEGHTLIISATGSEDRYYASYIETGHRIYHPSTGTAGPDVTPPQPYLRPSLYQTRSL